MQAALLVLLTAVFFTAAPVWAAKQVLYLYGDVAADGTVPSGDLEPFHQMRLNDTGSRGMSQFAEALRQAGFAIDEAYDGEVKLTPDFLENIDVLILGSNQRRFDDDEAQSLDAWVRAGGGLVAWSDSAFGGHYHNVGVDNETGRLSNNDLTVQFGMFFMTDNGAGNYLIETYEKDHFLNAHNRNGGIRFRGEGVSPVRVSAPAEMLARLQDGGLGGGLRLNSRDGLLDPERDAALAIASIGNGRAVGVFDRNLFWNAGEGSRLSHNDNREFTQRLMIWAAGLEDEWAERTKDLPPRPTIRNEVPSVAARYATIAGKLAVDLIAEIDDPDEDGIDPEATWHFVGRADDVTFENNNPNGPRVRVFFKEPGTYPFLLIVDDGDFSLAEQLEVKVTR